MTIPPFSGTAYLGLDHHASQLIFLQQGLQQYGAHYGGSRWSDLAPAIYADAEAGLARFTGAPAALVVSSGTVAGQLMGYMPELQGAEFHYAPWTHPALWRAGGKKYRSSAGWTEGILASLAQGKEVVALADTVSPLYAIQPTWDWLLDIPSGASLTVIADDSHGLGVAGEAGAGAWAYLRQRWNGRLLVCASMGKAFSTPAGVILGDAASVASLRALPQFGSASPPTPACLHAWLQAFSEGLLFSQHQRLQQNITFCQHLLAEAYDFYHLPGYPFFCTARHDLAAQLKQQGIIISSFHYPGPNDPRVTRAVVRAIHEEEDLRQLAAGILT